MGMDHNPVDLKIETLADAKHWLDVHHRWGIKDAENFCYLLERVRWLERPWWRRIFRKRPQ